MSDMSLTIVITSFKAAFATRRRWVGLLCLGAWLVAAAPSALAQVYRWVDAEGVTHLSSEKPPAGVKAERIDIAGSLSKRSSSSASRSSGSGSSTAAPASAAQVAQREELLGSLRTRECVVALEALERKTSGAEPTGAAEIRRLKQTAELNCSQDPARRREQESMAAKLRVANSPACVAARNQLADMMAPGATVNREQLRTQQAFVDEHCTSPIR
jgi:hypothetical protein